MSYLGPISSHKHKVDFGKIIVLSHLYIAKGKVTKISYSLDNIKYFETKADFGENINLHNLVCRYLSFDADIEFTYDLGTGYIGYPADEWTNKFVKDYGWTGGDGLFSFNLTGADNRFAKESDKSLLIFGDTFVGTLSKDHVRLAPLAMPNNSYCELDSIDCNKSNFDFHVNEDEKGRIKAYLEPTNELMQEGTQAYHLVNYASKSLENNYLSSYAPKKDISITFKFFKTYVDFIEIENYFVESEKDYGYQKRGVKNITILVNGQNIKTELQSSSYTTIGSTIIPIKKETDEVTFIIPNKVNEGNFGGANNNEPLFGLHKVYFYRNSNCYLPVIKVDDNYEYLCKNKAAWFWLQDGVVLSNNFYSLPFVVTSDLTQPEGFQFHIEGIALTKTAIENGRINFSKTSQSATTVYRSSNGETITLGCAFYNNSFSSKEKNPDGYIYIYGYKSSFFDSSKGNQLIVARVKEEEFEDLNSWKYYNGEQFVENIEEVKGLLNNVSCELSVNEEDGKYLCVFTHNVQSPYIATSSSPTPYGPFDEMRIAYVCPEKLCDHMYIYNAKAHPHLSKEGELLVSYNINTSNFSENIQYGRTYGPRFIKLRKESEAK